MPANTFSCPFPRGLRTPVAGVLWALAMTGCSSDRDWARAVYQGNQSAARQCQLAARPGAAPCPALSSHGAYEQERQRLKPASGAAP